MNENKIRAALIAYNQNPEDGSARETIIGQLRGYAVIARQPDGKIDVDETMDGLGFALAADQTSIAGCISAEEFFAKPKPVIEADPIDGRPLRKGKTVSEPIVDWSGVTKNLRQLAAYARQTRQLPHVGAPCQSESIAAELAKGGDLPPPWPRLLNNWLLVCTKASGGDKVSRDTVEEVEEMLKFNGTKVSRPVPIVPARRVEPIMATEATNQLTSSEVRRLLDNVFLRYEDFKSFIVDFYPAVVSQLSGNMERQAVTNLLFEMVVPADVAQTLKRFDPARVMKHWPVDATGLDVFVIAQLTDRKLVGELMNHLFMVKNKASSFDCSAGNDAGAWLRGRISVAKILVVMVTPSLLCDDAMMDTINAARMAGKRVVPVIAKPCMWEASSLSELRALGADLSQAASSIYDLLRRP